MHKRPRFLTSKTTVYLPLETQSREKFSLRTGLTADSLSMRLPKIPNIWSPTFTWPHRLLGTVPLASTFPSTPSLASKTTRRVVGFLHSYLPTISLWYCKVVGIEFDNCIVPLPFGLVLKWSDDTRLEEVAAMLMARAAGLPVPFVISYGDHLDTPHAPVSILMTRVPGHELGEVYENMSTIEKHTIKNEMNTILDTMRGWCKPHGRFRVCSVMDTSIRSLRIPDHLVLPCDTESEFNEHLLRPAFTSYLQSEDKDLFDQKLSTIDRLHSVRHPIVFTHGDLKHHNIMVHNGHVSGFIDWECAGWYPDYWEFTTALRRTSKDFWWYDFVTCLAGGGMEHAMKSEMALQAVTGRTYRG